MNTGTSTGLPAERTALAWLRTSLSFVAGALVMVRLLAHHNLALAGACAAVTLPLGLAVSWFAWNRHRHHEHVIRHAGRMAGGLLPLAVAVLAFLVGSSGIVYVLLE